MKQPKDSHAHPEPAEVDLRKCAYFHWQEENSPAGRDLDLWLNAREFVLHHVRRREQRPPPARGRRRA